MTVGRRCHCCGCDICVNIPWHEPGPLPKFNWWNHSGVDPIPFVDTLKQEWVQTPIGTNPAVPWTRPDNKTSTIAGRSNQIASVVKEITNSNGCFRIRGMVNADTAGAMAFIWIGIGQLDGIGLYFGGAAGFVARYRGSAPESMPVAVQLDPGTDYEVDICIYSEGWLLNSAVIFSVEIDGVQIMQTGTRFQELGSSLSQISLGNGLVIPTLTSGSNPLIVFFETTLNGHQVVGSDSEVTWKDLKSCPNQLAAYPGPTLVPENCMQSCPDDFLGVQQIDWDNTTTTIGGIPGIPDGTYSLDSGTVLEDGNMLSGIATHDFIPLITGTSTCDKDFGYTIDNMKVGLSVGRMTFGFSGSAIETILSIPPRQFTWDIAFYRNIVDPSELMPVEINESNFEVAQLTLTSSEPSESTAPGTFLLNSECARQVMFSILGARSVWNFSATLNLP